MLKKHGSSKIFLVAIILPSVFGVITVLLHALGVYLFWNSADAAVLAYKDRAGILVISSFVISIINLFVTLFMNGSLFSAYRYFSGSSSKKTGLKTYTELTLASIILFIIEAVFLAIILIGGFPVAKDVVSYQEIESLKYVAVILLLLLSPFIIGVFVLSILNYFGIKKWVKCAYAADEDRADGKTSSFVYVYAIITSVVFALGVSGALFKLLTTPFVAYSFVFDVGRLLNLGAGLASTILYIILMKRFKRDLQSYKK